ncbi:glutathionylspermidine synthase family protein [Laceyella putida]|uniref:Glutathionylspermidine synthase family protein n=1 Tax=Laceyella putida TaxID=110101 RepID=A0ABW2RG67_9BACL
MGQSEYRQRRSHLYTPIKEAGVFTWDRDHHDGTEYALATVHPISESFRRELAFATERLGQIFAKTVRIIQEGSDALLRELGIPDAAWRAVRHPIMPSMPTLIGRFDFAHTPQGLKMLEFNSDTPTCVVEAFHVNGLVCEALGYADPNQGEHHRLRQAFQELLEGYRQWGYSTERIVFSALDWHVEDAGTTKYLLQQSGLEAVFAPLSSLAVKGDRLYVLAGETASPVDVLYRLHALEILADDQDEQGYPTGKHLLKLVADKRLALINPPGAILSQTKALQALIWNLSDSQVFYTAEERECIHRYMLPTYVDNPFHGKRAYVTKPIFGREGGAVTLYDQTGATIARDHEELYWEQMMIYQELAEMEKVEVETCEGRFEGELLWSSFLIGGQASAIVARVDKKITGDSSYFLPVGLMGEREKR